MTFWFGLATGQSRPSRAAFRIFVVAALFLAVPAQTVLAATITVTSTADAGPGTLRQALLDALDGDTIDASGVFGTVLLTSGELPVNRSVTIVGPGAGSLAIDGNATGRVFHLLYARPVVISDVTIRNGKITGSFPNYGLGGGVFNEGSVLTLTRCTLSGNSADYGGGIYIPSQEDVVTVIASTLSGNAAGQWGGAIVNSGTLDVVDSTLSGNSAVVGGAIATGSLTSAKTRIVSSTFSANSASSQGGAIWLQAGSVEIGNTILKAGSAGENIFRYPTSPTPTVTSRGFNLSSDNGGAFLTAQGDQINTDPQLGPLADNGGPTRTHLPLNGSPAIDQGSADTIPELDVDSDQRGVARTYDNPTIANATLGDGTDIGAVELQPARTATADLLVGLGADKVSVKQGDTITYTVTVRNFGPDAAPNVMVNDVLAGATTFVSAQANKGTFTAPPAGQTGVVTWTISTMPNGDLQSAQIRVTVIVTGKTTSSITNTATVSSGASDPNTGNNSASIVTPVANGSSGKKK